MEFINKPSFQVKEVYKTCISKVKNAKLKSKLEACVNELEDDERLYDEMAASTMLFEFNAKDSIGENITNEEMKKVYTNRMVPKNSPGRDYYNKLLSSSSVCPLCSIRIISTLDHYLPKDGYSSLVVTPINLIPSCGDCNKVKLDKIAQISEELTLHPYYDDISSDIWLHARIIPNVEGEPLFEFFVDPPINWDVTLIKRIEHHFIIFELKKLYGVHAVQEFNGIKRHLNKLYSQGGAAQVKQYLYDIGKSWNEENHNSWKSAMYRTLADDVWFINVYLEKHNSLE